MVCYSYNIRDLTVFHVFIVQPVGTVLPGVSLDASDRDIPIGDWISYTLLNDGGSTGAHLFVANNVTNQVTVAGEPIVDGTSDGDERTISMLVRENKNLFYYQD